MLSSAVTDVHCRPFFFYMSLHVSLTVRATKPLESLLTHSWDSRGGNPQGLFEVAGWLGGTGAELAPLRCCI